MASGIKLVYTFTDNAGKKVQYSYNYADSSATTQQVMAVATALITNTAVLAKTLVSIDKIVQIETAETEYDINGYALTTAKPPEIINGNPDIPETGDNVTVTATKI